jgi:hypothetical protein
MPGAAGALTGSQQNSMSTTSAATKLTGEEWEEWANLLLQRRYGPGQYQRVPDTDRGDAGIEGFTVSSGHAYQAFGCAEPISIEQRYLRQRDKMTDDLRKFVRNTAKLSALLGNLEITRWCLFVPRFDSRRIVEHASAKTREVIDAALPYVADDFRVMVCEEADFAAERDALICVRPLPLYVEPPEATPQHVDLWAGTNDELVARLDAKIARLATVRSEDKRIHLRNRMIKHYLEGQNVLSLLGRDYPTLFDKLIAVKSSRENFLATQCLISTGTPNQVLQDALANILRVIKDDARGLSSQTAEALSYEAVADWMIRCPLDFPEVASND